jgi:SPP1 gp7 family putative phage head morphogenesis protein
MKFDLATLARRASNRLRRTVIFRPIFTTKAQADDLALLYLRITKLLAERQARLVEIYRRTLEQKLRHDTIDELGVEVDDIGAALNRLVVELTPALRRWAVRTEEWHRGKWKRSVLDAVNVSLETMLGPEDMREMLDAFLQRNVALVRNVSDEARGRIADSIFRGFQRRAPAVQMAKEIREATSMARARSIRIAGDQTVKLASALTRERRRQAQLTEWKWRHSGKLHFRPEHKARDGNLYTDATAPEDLPGELPFCGCVEQAVLTFDK